MKSLEGNITGCAPGVEAWAAGAVAFFKNPESGSLGPSQLTAPPEVRAAVHDLEHQLGPDGAAHRALEVEAHRTCPAHSLCHSRFGEVRERNVGLDIPEKHRAKVGECVELMTAALAEGGGVISSSDFEAVRMVNDDGSRYTLVVYIGQNSIQHGGMPLEQWIGGQHGDAPSVVVDGETHDLLSLTPREMRQLVGYACGLGNPDLKSRFVATQVSSGEHHETTSDPGLMYRLAQVALTDGTHRRPIWSAPAPGTESILRPCMRLY